LCNTDIASVESFVEQFIKKPVSHNKRSLLLQHQADSTDFSQPKQAVTMSSPAARSLGSPSQANQPQVYQIDFTAVASGKRIASTKRRVRW
jgi:hypothetical protein